MNLKCDILQINNIDNISPECICNQYRWLEDMLKDSFVLFDVCEHFILIYRYVRFGMIANEITFHFYDNTGI